MEHFYYSDIILHQHGVAGAPVVIGSGTWYTSSVVLLLSGVVMQLGEDKPLLSSDLVKRLGQVTHEVNEP